MSSTLPRHIPKVVRVDPDYLLVPPRSHQVFGDPPLLSGLLDEEETRFGLDRARQKGIGLAGQKGRR